VATVLNRDTEWLMSPRATCAGEEEPMRGDSCGERSGVYSRAGSCLLVAVSVFAIVAAGCGGESSGNKSSNNGPVVRGAWADGCNQYGSGDYEACKAIRVSRVTCQWRDDKVRMTLVFKNTFGAHVTMHFNPEYTLKNAGLHGNGLTASQDVGLDPGERREYSTNQDPKGVKGQPAITRCSPKVDILQGAELG
jgi:hypothetical protein